MVTDWKQIDEKLIRRGELILELGFLENYQEELEAMNHAKEGRPYRLTDTYIQFLTAVRYLYGMPYRQLEGFTRALHRLLPRLPSGDYSGLRKRSLSRSLDPYRALKEADEPITIAVDSTGVKVHRAGGWVERRHGKKKRYVKLHFAVDVRTKEVVALEVSTDDTHDVVAFPKLVAEAEKHGRVSEALGDGAYDSRENFSYLAEKGIEPAIKVRRNSSGRARGCHARKRVVLEYLRDAEAWNHRVGYGLRWMAETAFSAFKRLFGEHVMARSIPNMVREMLLKASLYNLFMSLNPAA